MADHQHSGEPPDAQAAKGKRFATRVLLIGWDGAELATLRALLAAGDLPHLGSLLNRGVALELAVPRPAFAQAAWTSLATAKRPHEHGVLHPLCCVTGSSAVQPVTRRHRRCSALWNILSKAGLHTHVVGWPVTHPADPLAGISVSDRFATDLEGSSIATSDGPWVLPPAAAQPLIERSVAAHQVEELTLRQLLPVHAIGSRMYARPEAMCREILAHTATLFRAIRWCMSAQPWDLAACVFSGIRRCHKLANWLRGQTPTAAELCKPLIAGCYGHHDLLLGQLLSQVDNDTHVIVVSATGSLAPGSADAGDGDTPAALFSVSRNSGMAVISGPGVSHREGPVSRSILDTVPTILSLLAVPYGEDMGGRPWADLFAGRLESNTVDTWDSCGQDHAPQATYASDEPTDNVAAKTPADCGTEHLVELGYVDPLAVAAAEAVQDCERTTALNRAISKMDAGLLSEATAEVEQLTQQYPDWFHSRSLLAEIYFRARNRIAARQEIAWLLSHGFENPQLYLLAAAIELADRQFDRALDELCCARRGSVQPHGAAVIEGNIQLRRRDFQKAADAFQQAIQSEGATAPAWDGLATANLHLGKFEEAAVCALDALEKDMGLGKAHYHLAAALYFLNRPQEALQALGSWAALEPNAGAPYRWMAMIYRSLLDDLPQARSCIDRGRHVIRRRRHSRGMP